MKDYLFVYGTLAVDPPAEISATVKQLNQVGDGFIFGRLYDVGKYPGAVLDDHAGEKVLGKILALPNDKTILRRLDAYEGFDPQQPAKSLFVRKRAAISRNNQPPLRAWVYEYNRPVKSLPVIKSGHYSRMSV